MYNLVMLSLMLLPEMFLRSLLELCTWFSCLVLRRNQKMLSLLIRYHGLIQWSTMENSMVKVSVFNVFKRRECQSSIVLRHSIISCMYRGLVQELEWVEHMEYMKFKEFMDKGLCGWLWLIVKWCTAHKFMWTDLIPFSARPHL